MVVDSLKGLFGGIIIKIYIYVSTIYVYGVN